MRDPSKDGVWQDGVWQVATGYLCAGFVVKDGKVVRCAPILRKKLPYWMKLATWVGP